MSNGTQIHVLNSMRTAANNSANEGGFAYLEGKGTYMYVGPNPDNPYGHTGLEGQNGYLGGAFHLKDEARVDLEQVTIARTESYDGGAAFLTDHAYIQIERCHFDDNLMHHRALIYTEHFSRFLLE